MKIAILGATGMSGQTIYREAVDRGHDVTAFVRTESKAKETLGDDAKLKVADVFELTTEDLTPFEVVVNALGTPRGHDIGYLHIDMAAHLIRILRNTTSPRIFFMLGAASLLDKDGNPFIDSFVKDTSSASWIDTPLMQVHEYHFLQTVTNVNWVGISPSLSYGPGPKTGYVRNDKNQALFDSSGKPNLMSGNLATALLDEIEAPSINQARFTVGNND